MAVFEHHHPVADLEQFFQPVGDIDEGLSLLLQLVDDLEPVSYTHLCGQRARMAAAVSRLRHRLGT